MPFDNFDDGRKVMNFLVIGKGGKDFGEARFE